MPLPWHCCPSNFEEYTTRASSSTRAADGWRVHEEKGSCPAASTPSPYMPHLAPSWFSQLVLFAHAVIHNSCGLFLCREYGKVLDMGSTVSKGNRYATGGPGSCTVGPRLSQSEPSSSSSPQGAFRASSMFGLAQQVVSASWRRNWSVFTCEPIDSRARYATWTLMPSALQVWPKPGRPRRSASRSLSSPRPSSCWSHPPPCHRPPPGDWLS